MKEQKTPIAGFTDTKRHYEILDGLRGVAAIIVVLMHLFETFTGGSHLVQIINHGYLAVDFFFLLSGFVIGYAYDERWQRMSVGEFFKRRLIRLHPMIIVGMIIGAIGFYYSASPSIFPLVANTPPSQVLLIMLIGFTLLPIPISMDIRGWSEMHPLDGPAWSLFFEYIANILYALFVRKWSNTVLSIFVFLSGIALIHLAVTSPAGDVIGGWSLNATQLRIGFTRLLYPFFAGLLLSRIAKPGNIRYAFVKSSLLLVTLFSIPRIGGATHLWMNGLYESLAIIFLFPVVVYIGASGTLSTGWTSKVCKYLGDISYPLYITHYPLIYIFTAWVYNEKIPLTNAWGEGLLVLLVAVGIATASLYLYDIPVRKWLMKKWMKKAS